MSTIKVDKIRHNSASTDAITLASDGTCDANIKSIAGGQLAGFRNLVINGSMKVHQRASSATGLGNGYHTADRMYTRRSNSSATYNSTVSNGVLTLNNPSAATGLQVRHGIEWDNVFYDKTMTLSFNAEAGSGTIQVYVSLVDGEVGSTTAQHFAHLTGTTTDVDNLTLTAVSGTKYEVTVDLPADSAVSFTPDMVRITVSTTSAAGQSLALSKLQFEFGSNATPFEYRSFGEEMHLCKRYYAQIEQTLYGCAYSTGSGFVHHFHVPEMRATPSFTYTGRATSTGFNHASYSNYKIFQCIMSHLSPYVQGAKWDAEL